MKKFLKVLIFIVLIIALVVSSLVLFIDSLSLPFRVGVFALLVYFNPLWDLISVCISQRKTNNNSDLGE